MPNTRPKNTKDATTRKRTGSSIQKLRIAVAVVVLVMVISVVFAFIWPGWAVRKANVPNELPTATSSATPTISASALPSDASSLLSAMPDSVANFVRTSVKTTETWKKADPLEEYQIVYSTGNTADDVTLTVAQWSDEDDASKQYSALDSAATGDQLAAGNVKVDGKITGQYVVKDAGNNKAMAIWVNSTVVFEATGPKSAVETVYQQFPL